MLRRAYPRPCPYQSSQSGITTMLGSALYFPYIDIQDPAWLRSAVLFWDEIKTIVPKAVNEPYRQKDTRILWQEGFLEPLSPDMHPELLDTLGKRVVSLMDIKDFRDQLNLESLLTDPNSQALIHADKIGLNIRDQFERARIHPEKLSPALRSLAMRAGLAGMHPEKLSPDLRYLIQDVQFATMHSEKMSREMQKLMRRANLAQDNDGDWLIVDSRFAEVYMSALAALLAKETELAALTNEEPSMGVNLHTLLQDVKPSEQSDKKGALVSFVMEAIRVDPKARIDKLLAFRRSRQMQLAELSAQFEDLSFKIASCESFTELKEKAKDSYVTRIRPKLESLKDELKDVSIQSYWDGFSRAVQVTAPAGSALGYFGQLNGFTSSMMLAAGAGITVTEIAIKSHLATKKARRASPYTYLLDVERKFSLHQYE